MKKYTIGQIVSPFVPVPPHEYGGTELIVSLLTEQLVKNGHDVTLFASGDSQTAARLESIFPQALDTKRLEEQFSPSAKKLEWLQSLPLISHISFAMERATNFDIIHNHSHYFPLFFEQSLHVSMVHTYHGDFSSACQSPIERMLLEKYQTSKWVAISESQKRTCPLPLNFLGVVYHGIDVTEYEFSANHEGYLVWLGRITEKKGILDAVEVAKRVGKKLVLAGVVLPGDKMFFEEKVLPVIDAKQIEYVGPVNHIQKVALLKDALALLYPISWEEPFGLVMIEAMACGVPVVAYKKGAVPEVVIDGQTGFVVSGKEEMIQAIGKLSGIDRGACRLHVEQNFSVERMVASYEAIYERCMQGTDKMKR